MRTKRRQIQKGSRREYVPKELLRCCSIMNSRKIMIVGLDNNGKVRFVNRKGCNVLGYTFNEIVGKDWFKTFIPKKDREQVKDIFRKCMSGKIKRVEYKDNFILTKDKKKRIINCNNSFIKDKNGKIIGTFIFGEDVTEKNKIDERAKSFARFPSENPNIVMRASKEGTILYANIHARLLLNKRDEVIKKRFEYTLKKAYRLNKKKKEEFSVDNKTYLLTFVPLPANGYVNIYGEDVTKREITAETEKKELIELDRLKTEFLSLASHELKNPLTPMLSQLQMIASGDLGRLNKEQLGAFNVIQRSAIHLTKLIEDILDISRLQSKRMKFVFKKVDINKVVKESCLIMNPIAREKRMKIGIRLKNLPKVSADPDRILQVLNNYISNAIKFTEKEGHITISTAKRDHKVIVRVKDSGIGIKKKYQYKIFAPFFRTVDTVSGKRFGFGLGLTICKGIIEEHGGSVGFKSEFGKGSTFYFTLDIKPKIKVADNKINKAEDT